MIRGKFVNKIILSILIIFVFSFEFYKLSAENFELKEVLTIGSDKRYYEFFLISSVDTDVYGNVYIADSKGFFIRKYTKDGKFIGEVGKRGRGAGDFWGPIDLTVGDDRLFVWDGGNRRIAVYDLQFNKKPKYYKIGNSKYFTNIFYMNKLLYLPLMFRLNSKENKNRIIAVRLGKQVEIVKEFFNHYPNFYNNVDKNNKIKMAVASGWILLKIACNEKRNEIVGSFMFPDKKIKLFYYNGRGEFLKKQTLEILKNYSFPRFLLKYPPKYPKQYTLMGIDSIHYFKNKYLLLKWEFLKNKLVNNNREKESKSYIIFVDIESGKIIGKKKIPSGFGILKVRGNYLYAKNSNDDVEKLHIFKIEGIE